MNLKRLLLHILTITAFSSSMVFANLLQNPSFEEAGSEGEQTARYWNYGDPDAHGGYYGNATRENWRAHEGNFTATIRGTWAELGDYGGWWQESEGDEDTAYTVSAWFFADEGWSASTQEMKIEFWDESRQQLLHAESTSLSGLSESWKEFRVEGTAPEGTVWVRAVVNVAGAGDTGALQVDLISLEAAATIIIE